MWESTRRLVYNMKPPHKLELWIFYLYLLISYVLCECPSDLTTLANGCLTDYSSQLQNMQKSRHTLISGLDVETLRAFCSAYKSGMSCIDYLRKECPQDRQEQINVALVNLRDAQAELSELCENDKLYEVYAIYQSCFMREGARSERCFHQYFNTTIRIMTRLDHTSIHDMCSELHGALTCIKYNIQLKCKANAARLVDVLVKPMIKKSSQCRLMHMQMTTTEEYKQKDAGITYVNPPINHRDTHKLTSSANTHCYSVSLLTFAHIILTFRRL